jgi:iron complex outermembrane recepter protein
MSALKSRFALCVSVLALVCAQQAYGQDDTGGDGQATVSGLAKSQVSNLETVVVVGEKFGRTIKETSSSVSIIGSQDITANTLQVGRDAFEQMVNVTVADESNFHIRGVAFDNVNGAGFGALGTIYVDNVRMSDKSTRFGPDLLWDVQSVEVLRGAQSTMQGRNALAGAIYINSVEPTFDWQFKGRATVSNGNGRDFALAASGPIVDDVLAFRVTAEKHNFDGFITNPILKTDKVDFSDDYQLRGKLLFTPSSDLTVHLNLSYSDVKRRDARSDTRVLGSDGYLEADDSTELGPESGVPGQASAYRRVTYTNIPEYDDNRTYAGSLIVDYNLSDRLKLTSETSGERNMNYHQRDSDGGYFKYDYTGGTTMTLENPYNIRGPKGTVNVDPFENQYEDYDLFSQELRLKYSDDNFKAVVGLYGTKEMEREDNYTHYVYRHLRNTIVSTAESYGLDATTSSYVASNYSDDVPVYCFDSEPVDVRNWAAYGEFEYTLFDKLTFNLGMRYDSEWNKSGVVASGEVLGLADSSDFSAVSAALAELVDGINDAINPFTNSSYYAEQNFSAFLPKVGVRYDISEDVTVGVVAQRAYRAGGVSVNVYRQLVTDLKPEYTNNYEAFLRASLLDGTAHLEANVYLTDWKDQQVQVDLSDKETDVMGVNAGKSRLYGFELQFGTQLSPRWNMYGGVGYSHTEFLDFDITVPDSLSKLGVSVSSNALSSLEGNFFADAPEWTATLGGEWRDPRGYFANVGIRFQGASYSDTANLYKNDARALVNARVGIDFENYSLSFFARNLFDVNYISENSASRPELGQPRIFGASIDAHY